MTGRSRALVEKRIDASAEMGVIPKRVEITPELVDLTLIEEATRRIDGKHAPCNGW